jgi:hypothetical protein
MFPKGENVYLFLDCVVPTMFPMTFPKYLPNSQCVFQVVPGNTIIYFIVVAQVELS